LSRYFKKDYLPLLILFNASFFVYCLLPLTLMQFGPLMLIAIVVLKWLKMPILYEIMLVDPKDCSDILLARFNKEMGNFCWFVNKFNFRCFLVLLSLYCSFSLIENYLSSSVSWWLLCNLLIFYAGMTRTSKSHLKFKLGFYREYTKYVIHIIEPNSPER
jgi:hypothetical protein